MVTRKPRSVGEIENIAMTMFEMWPKSDYALIGNVVSFIYSYII
jgi:hypothetical protein